MKNPILLSLGLLCVLIIGCAALFVSLNNNHPPVTSQAPAEMPELKGEAPQSIKMGSPIETELQNSEPEPSKAPYCFVTAKDGYIAVYDKRWDASPLYVTDISLSLLPSIDRQLFESGFYLYSEEELHVLLEDFGS